MAKIQIQPPGVASPASGSPAPKSLSATITATGAGTLDINPLIAAGYTRMRAELKAGGGGGGSGRRGTAGSARVGGGPGGEGGFVAVEVPLSVLLATWTNGLVPYTVGVGGAGGAAVTTDDTNGNDGANTGFGGSDTYNTFIGDGAVRIAVARAGTPGGGGGNGSGGGAGGTLYPGTVPGVTGWGAEAAGGNANNYVYGSAGAGGGITTGNVPGNGAFGAAGWGSTVGGNPYISAPGGVAGGALPGTGTAGPILLGSGPYPGGGAASITGPAQAGADAPANSGAGGGGGGASLNGFNSGKGGDGAAGFFRYTAY